ncbi:MAG: PAS domain-containing protein [Desulfovibrio sp.]|jgi:methyl-accepting chemotaxis protein|nr:PAS domain-containing protein [Desulfovibrio sp.]
MTTKIKIITGFVAMIAIVACVSVIGYRSLSTASALFLDFDRIAALNTYAKESISNINTSAYYLEKFMRLSEGEDMDKALSAQEKSLASVERVLQYTVLPERRQKMEQAVARLREYVEALRQMKNAFVSWYADHLQVLNPGFDALRKILGEIGDAARRENNAAALGQMNDVWRLLADLNSAVNSFRERGLEERAAAVDKLLEQARGINERFRAALATEEEAKAFARYQEQYKAIVQNYQRHKGAVLRAEAVLTQAYGWDAELEEKISRLNMEAGEEWDRRRGEIIASNNAAQGFMLISSAFGLILGAIFALFILVGLISVLNKISAFASAVADGDFERDAGIREKGEIGNMAAAIQRIPATLKAILSDYLQLEKKIEGGNIAQKVDAGNYHGGFSILVNGTNAILARLNMVIDSIPSPVILLNKDARIEYMNKAAVAMAGPEYRGKTCKQMFNREDDGGSADALAKAAATRQPAGGETKAHPGGADLDISYTVIPLLDKENRLAALLQLLTDLTVTKAQNRKILLAASKASEISSRVAEASEEISVQV